ncbi:dephospho-CoA kinase [Oceanobacillus indicireducens]|uniref:Dephospho-CoA kinase n=1 Tax=Oceanobacillus indicireducens TaxID=1004261 RepID=A0A917XQJ4_9BACI|nr:dephospho-CoA kinase [Oceanobacillus indicireducens]GGN48999.1 dephospho-CoA kinase [Oceanobacillus indicireducens]
MSLVIGLTGSIATGKSTVAKMFRQLGIPVIDADILAREVVEPGEDAYKKVIETFGEDILLDDKTLNRKRLGEIVFTDETKRKQLNGIVHPAIRKRMLEKRDHFIREGYQCVVLDIPLLFESKLQEFVDKILVVYADQEIQLQRLMARNEFSEEEAMQRIQSQMPVKKKASLADAVINNNSTKEETYEQLRQLLEKWQILETN